jgi:hypothetical protein
MDEMEFFKTMGKEKSYKFILEIIKIGRRYDCNPGEILEQVGDELGICYYCFQQTDDIEDGLCKKCRGE